VGIVPYASLDNPAPIATAVNQIGLPWFAILVKIGAIAGLSSVMLVLLYGQTRIFYTMSRDGLLPSALAAVHKRFKTPWINTIIVGIAACGAAGFMSLDALADLSNVGSLAAFAIVCATVIYLRFTAPNLARPFKAPAFLVTGGGRHRPVRPAAGQPDVHAGDAEFLRHLSGHRRGDLLRLWRQSFEVGQGNHRRRW